MSWTIEDTERSIPARFKEMVGKHGAKTAIGGTAWQPTFEELDRAANGIAADLLERAGEGPGNVALQMRHDAPLVAAVLGVLKAGKTAVALNPGDPPVRLDSVLREVEPQLVLEDREDPPDASPHPTTGVAPGPRDLALLIYTSGSTGRPKGVMQTHRNVLHNVLRHTSGLGLVADDRVVLLGALSGGQGMGTLWSTLLNGATLCPFPIMERGLTGLADWLGEQAITVFPASASLFRRFAGTLNGTRLEGLRLVRLASEPSVDADLEAFRRSFGKGCALVNTFSSSETGNISRCFLNGRDRSRDGRLPAGTEAEGIGVLLLGEDGGEVAPGETGEIVVRSDYLSPGYWRNEELTAERYEGDCFHTGDIGTRSEDGVLTVVGRHDGQVKVRGQRVELPEVERVLLSHPAVAAGAILTAEAGEGEVRVTAYVEPARGAAGLEAAELRRWLARTLPDAAVPGAFVVMDALPLTPQGKVDRSLLEEAEPAPPPARRRAMSPTEEVLAEIWARALGRESVGPDEDFFDIGGESLTAAVIAAEAHAALGTELELRAFAERPTVAAMAELIERPGAPAPGGRPALGRALRSASLPCSFIQEHVWRHSRAPGTQTDWNTASSLSLRGPLDVDALRRAVERIAGRHEALRTRFVEHDGRPHAVVGGVPSLEVPLLDLSAAPDPAAATEELFAREAAVEFDLARGPLVRLLLVRLGESEHRLLRMAHHIITDAWSWRIFLTELAALYEAAVEGRPPPLPAEMPFGYADFAAWERRCLNPASRAYNEELAWWERAFADQPEPMSLPFARATPAGDAVPADGMVWWGLDPEVSRRLDRLGREGAATFYMVRLAALGARLVLDTGRDDVQLGTYVTNRRLPELQAMFGFFNNHTILRLRGASELSFRAWLARVRTTVIETSARTAIPHQRLWTELKARDAVPPEPRAIFSMFDQVPRVRFGGLEVEQRTRVAATMPWRFTFMVDRWREGSNNLCSFDARSHDPDAVRAFIDRYRELAAAVCEAPDAPICELAGERQEPPEPRTGR